MLGPQPGGVIGSRRGAATQKAKGKQGLYGLFDATPSAMGFGGARPRVRHQALPDGRRSPDPEAEDRSLRSLVLRRPGRRRKNLHQPEAPRGGRARPRGRGHRPALTGRASRSHGEGRSIAFRCLDPRYRVHMRQAAIHEAIDREQPDVLEVAFLEKAARAGRWQAMRLRAFIFHQDPVAVARRRRRSAGWGASVRNGPSPFWELPPRV